MAERRPRGRAQHTAPSISHIVRRDLVKVGKGGEVHLTLAEHAPNPPFLRGRTYVYLHTKGAEKDKAAWLGATDLRRLINRLERLHSELLAAPSPRD